MPQGGSRVADLHRYGAGVTCAGRNGALRIGARLRAAAEAGVSGAPGGSPETKKRGKGANADPPFTRPLSLPDIGQVRCGSGQKWYLTSACTAVWSKRSPDPSTGFTPYLARHMFTSVPT